jgi:3-oxoacyl-[acyl-carrier-protein] synthase-1
MPLLPDRIVVTATGIMTALGTGREAHIAHLQDGTSVLQHPAFLETRHAAEFVVGEISADKTTLAGRLGIDQAKEGYTRTALISLCAMQDLLVNSDKTYLQNAGGRLAFINANTVGGMSEVESLYPSLIDITSIPEDTHWIDSLDCAESTEQVARAFGLTPCMATISTACSSSANAMLVGARMLQHGLADVVIAGGGDALCRFTLNGFHSLKNIDKQPCRPFDNSRNGLNLGEGAAYVVLERESDAYKRGAYIEAIFSGWCNTNDAYHPTAPSPDGSGALRTMHGALAKAGLRPDEIDYINTHGTATINNDAAEGKAIETLWEGHPPPFSSTKPFTGHTLAGAGAVEAIIAIWAMQEGFIPPNLNWQQPMEELTIRPATEAIKAAPIQHVMSNSFGFGGNNVTLIFSRA